MALELGFDKAAPERVMSGIKFLLRQIGYLNGHTFLPRSTVSSQAAQMLEKDGAREYTQSMADRLTQEALASLDRVIVDRATGMELQSLAMQLLKRNR